MTRRSQEVFFKQRTYSKEQFAIGLNKDRPIDDNNALAESYNLTRSRLAGCVFRIGATLSVYSVSMRLEMSQPNSLKRDVPASQKDGRTCVFYK